MPKTAGSFMPKNDTTNTAAAAGNKTNLIALFNIQDLSDEKLTDQSILLFITNFDKRFLRQFP
jgi:hypothetical protein